MGWIMGRKTDWISANRGFEQPGPADVYLYTTRTINRLILQIDEQSVKQDSVTFHQLLNAETEK